MESEGSLPSSQKPSTGPYPEPDYYFFKIHFNIILHLRLDLPNGLLTFAFPTKNLYAFILSPCVLHALPISPSLTLSFLLYLAKSTRYEAPHYATFSSLLLFHPSSV
jgi:hypothetical protein